MTTLKSFIEASNIPAAVVRAVVKSQGGWKEFKEYHADIANHGADGGWPGFIYYDDTVAFFRKHKADILAMLKADEFDTIGHGSVPAFCAQFRCLADVSEDAIAETLFGRWNGDNEWVHVVANGLAWYALEAVARDACNILD